MASCAKCPSAVSRVQLPMTPPATLAPLELTDDDRVLLHAIAMAGDAVHEADVAYLLARWPWAAPAWWARRAPNGWRMCARSSASAPR